MLHAFMHSKSRAYERFIGVKDKFEPRVSAEDEITSLVFGPLDFLSAADNWRLWKLVLQSHESNRMSGPLPSNFFSDDFIPTVCTQNFWPRKDGVEPDMQIVFSDDSGTSKSILLELKWAAPLSGDDQLERQWSRYQLDAQSSSLHVFLTKQDTQLPLDRTPWQRPEPGQILSCHLRSLRWHEFRHQIRKLEHDTNSSTSLKRWSALTNVFLGKLGIRPFVGFASTVQLTQVMGPLDHNAIEFWK